MKKLTAHEIRDLSVKASVDPRTIEKVLSGKPVKPMPLDRIRKALKEAGRSDALPAEVA